MDGSNEDLSKISGLFPTVNAETGQGYVDQAFVGVFNMEDEGDLSWLPQDEQSLVAEAILRNADDANMLVPVVFYRVMNPDFGVWDYYLHLGGKDGPCKNDADIRVAQLADKLFGDSHPLEGHTRREMEHAQAPVATKQSKVARFITKIMAR